MSDWISGRELLSRWNIKEIELFNYLNQGLRPYHKLRLSPILPPGIVARLDNLKKKKKELEVLEKSARKPSTLLSKRERLLNYKRKQSGIDDEKEITELRKFIKKEEELLKIDMNFWKLPKTEKEASHLAYNEVPDYLFKKTDVEKFERKFGLGLKNKYRKETMEEGPISERTEDNININRGIPSFSFYRSEHHWKIGEKGKEKICKDLQGLQHLHYLLKNEGKELRVLEVYHHGKIPEELRKKRDTYQEKIDMVAKKDYIKALDILEKKLDVTEDQEERNKINSRIKKIKNQLRESKYGFEADQKLRTNVLNNIKNSLEHIYKKIPELKNFLVREKTIITGYKLWYKQDVSRPVEWKLDSD